MSQNKICNNLRKSGFQFLKKKDLKKHTSLKSCHVLVISKKKKK